MTTLTTSQETSGRRQPATYSDWRSAVEHDLKGAPFEKRLLTSTPEGIAIQPLYRREDVARLEAAGRNASPLIDGRRRWDTGSEPEEYPLSPLPALALALECPAVGKTRAAGAMAADPLGWLAAHGTLPMPLDACFDDLARALVEADGVAMAGHLIAVGAYRWHEAGSTAVQELAFGLATGADYWRKLLERGVGPDRIGSRCRLCFAVGVDFYMEIAKLRAARLLWAKMSRAFGAGPGGRAIFIAARTSSSDQTIYDPHVNLLRITTEALAAVVGGADALDLRPFDEIAGRPTELGRRLARNLHEILAEEFFLDRQNDPAGGAWYVEVLTDRLAREAWALFQEIEGAGGMAQAIRAGRPQRIAAEAAATKQALVDTRRRPIVGTTIQPDLKEEPRPPAPAAIAPPASPAAPISDFATLRTAARSRALPELEAAWGAGRGAGPTATPLAPFRAAAGFEEVRRAGDDCLVRTGRRARVFLANMGPLKQHRARADFSSGFYSAGGFEVVAGAGLTTSDAAADAAVASGACLAVLCSTDDTYPELAPAFAKRVKAAAPGMVVVLAGHPGPNEAGYRAAGFDDFIHMRANVRATLARLQRLAGVLP